MLKRLFPGLNFLSFASSSRIRVLTKHKPLLQLIFLYLKLCVFPLISLLRTSSLTPSPALSLVNCDHRTTFGLIKATQKIINQNKSVQNQGKRQIDIERIYAEGFASLDLLQTVLASFYKKGARRRVQWYTSSCSVHGLYGPKKQ